MTQSYCVWNSENNNEIIQNYTYRNLSFYQLQVVFRPLNVHFLPPLYVCLYLTWPDTDWYGYCPHSTTPQRPDALCICFQIEHSSHPQLMNILSLDDKLSIENVCQVVIKYSPTERCQVLPVDVRNVNLFCCAAVRQTKSWARDVSNCGAH